jgi:simple sugar transport system permease protein
MKKEEKEMLVNLLKASVVAGTPLLLATLGELITEKAGNLNLGVEGMMLIGAISGFALGFYFQNPYMALMGAIIAGAVSALIYAFLTVTLRSNQVVSGLSLTIFGTGLSSFIGTNFVGKKMSSQVIDFFKPIQIPLLGEVLFNQDIYVYFSYFLALILGVYLYKTRKGMNLSAIGENPSAADAAGIKIDLYKYVHILVGGALCGLGGAYLSVVQVPTWQENITAGRGWIAIALVIFSKWNPLKSIYGAYLFGGLSIIGFRIQYLNISQNLLNMLPYIVTIVVLVFSSLNKSKEGSPPKALSLPYFREER